MAYREASPEMKQTAALLRLGCCRAYGERAGKLKMLRGAGGDGEHARELWGQWGWRWWWPELLAKLAGVRGGVT